jgi:hypothetical protein
MEMDVFLRESNIRRYRRLLDSSITSAERRTIIGLLADEMGRFKDSFRQTIADQPPIAGRPKSATANFLTSSAKASPAPPSPMP